MIRKLYILTIFYILNNILHAQDQGVQSYRNEKYKAAQKYYDSILSDDSESAEALFGKGSALFMQEELSQAESSFNATLPYSDNQLKSKTFYNLGNISFKNNKLDQALLFYKKALELNPDDDEARYNYEYIKYQKDPPEDDEKKDDEKKDDEKKDDEKKDDEKKDDEKKDDEKKDDEKKDDEKKDDEKKDDEKKDDEKNSDEKKQQPQDEKKSQDLKKAESILEAIKNDEKVMQKQQIKRAKTKKLLKDW